MRPAQDSVTSVPSELCSRASQRHLHTMSDLDLIVSKKDSLQDGFSKPEDARNQATRFLRWQEHPQDTGRAENVLTLFATPFATRPKKIQRGNRKGKGRNLPCHAIGAYQQIDAEGFAVV